MRSVILSLSFMTIVGGVFGLAQLCTAQKKQDIPPPQACYKKPGDTLCSDMPHDVLQKFGTGYDFITETGQRPFDNFSWQMFVALNWPADQKGKPLPKPIGSDQKAPRVWEAYKTVSQVFPDPLKGENFPALDQAIQGRQFRMLSTRSNIKPDGFLEAFPSDPLIDRNVNFVVYDISVNDAEAQYITGHQLNTVAGQKKLFLEKKPISFPLGHYDDNMKLTGGKVGAMEIKTAWRILDTTKGDKLERYYHIDGVIDIDKDHSMNGQAFRVKAQLGLVGMHIIQRTTGPYKSDTGTFPQDWIWATFEHVDNAPLATNAQDPDKYTMPPPNSGTAPTKVDRTYSFFNLDYKGTTNLPPKLLGKDKVFKWEPKAPYAKAYANPGGFGTQVVRCWKIYPSTVTVNTYFQGLLKDTVWQNYQLIGSQWMAGGDAPAPANGNVPRYLTNTTLETYIQGQGSCMECHASAKTAYSNKQSGNFSFLLYRAK